jgi:O-antigen biosynthesis protein
VTSNSSDGPDGNAHPPDGSREDLELLRAAVDGERANAAFWRAKAERDTAALQALRRRTSVRMALNLERRAEPVLRVARRIRARARRGSPTRAPRAGRGTDAPPVHFAITTAVPSEKIAARWGDWHFAHDLARALERLGYRTRVYTADHASEVAGSKFDVHLALRGLATAGLIAGRRNVLWIISHPEAVEVRDCDAADLVFVASERFAADLRTRTDTPVEVLLQATDHHRFVPGPPDPKYAHPITFVAKTREVMRPIIADALAVGLRPTIYGSGWEPFVDAGLIASDHVSNDDLPAVYRSAGVLLNDHWDTMRAWGFVSNRLFDALACGTPIVSDFLPEIRDLFDDAVGTYAEPGELRTWIEAALADPATARDRSGVGRARILAAHTFDHRAHTLVAALTRNGLLARV